MVTYAVKILDATDTKPRRMSVLNTQTGKVSIVAYNYNTNNVWEFAAMYVSNKMVHFSGFLAGRKLYTVDEMAF